MRAGKRCSLLTRPLQAECADFPLADHGAMAAQMHDAMTTTHIACASFARGRKTLSFFITAAQLYNHRNRLVNGSRSITPKDGALRMHHHAVRSWEDALIKDRIW